MAAAQPQLKPRKGFAIAASLAAVALASCGSGGPSSPRASAPARIPGAVEREVHRMLHSLPRVCGRARTDSSAVDRITRKFVVWYRRYPAKRFEMKVDDERGTMLSAILVVRHELAKCSQRHAAEIDRVLPAKIRAALTPLRAPGAPG